MSFEKEILSAIAKRGPDDPATLPDILWAIDFYERVSASSEEISEGLQALLRSGAIRELPGHRYIDAELGPGSADFSPISKEELDAARKEYGRRFRKTYHELHPKSRRRDRRPGGSG